jgi:hypothetical protein
MDAKVIGCCAIGLCRLSTLETTIKTLSNFITGRVGKKDSKWMKEDWKIFH